MMVTTRLSKAPKQLNEIHTQLDFAATVRVNFVLEILPSDMKRPRHDGHGPPIPHLYRAVNLASRPPANDPKSLIMTSKRRIIFSASRKSQHYFHMIPPE